MPLSKKKRGNQNKKSCGTSGIAASKRPQNDPTVPANSNRSNVAAVPRDASPLANENELVQETSQPSNIIGKSVPTPPNINITVPAPSIPNELPVSALEQRLQCLQTTHVSSSEEDYLSGTRSSPSNCTGQSATKKRVRGAAIRKKYTPPSGQLWDLDWNHNGCPIGENSTKLNRRIGLLARCSDLWPIDKNWNEMSWTSYIDTWDYIVREYNMTKNANAWNYTFRKVSVILRDWRAKVKEKYYMPFKDNPSILGTNLDPRIDKKQFMNLCEEWKTEESKKIASINSTNRRAKKMNHSTGSMTFARLSNAMKEKSIEKKTPTKLQLIGVAYASNHIVRQMNEFVANQQSLQSESDSHSLDMLENEAMERYLGPTRTNRQRAVGVGAILEGASSRKRIILERASHDAQTEMKTELEKVHAQVDELKKQNMFLTNMVTDLYARFGTNPPFTDQGGSTSVSRPSPQHRSDDNNV